MLYETILRHYIKDQNTFNALKCIEQMPNVFYLTGSYYFGDVTPESDFDFFCEYNKHYIEYLEKNGFELDELAGYSDTNTAGVFIRGKVHVQLVKDVELKHQIQLMLVKTVTFTGMNKLQKRQIWNLAYRLMQK